MTINIKMCENSKFSNRRKHVTIRVIGCLMNKTFDISQITLKKNGRNIIKYDIVLPFSKHPQNIDNSCNEEIM
jgi:hypothetical protein